MHLLNTLMGGVSSLGEGFSFPSPLCFYFTLMYSIGGKWSEEKGSIILVSRLIFDATSGVAPKWVSTRLCVQAPQTAISPCVSHHCCFACLGAKRLIFQSHSLLFSSQPAEGGLLTPSFHRQGNGVRSRKRLAGFHAVTAGEQPGGGRGGVSNLLLPLTSSTQPASSSVKAATVCTC